MEETPRRVAFYLASLQGGGAERVMLNLAQGMAERGFTVDMVLANATGEYLKQVPDNIRIVDLKARRVLTSIPGLCSYLRERQPAAMVAAVAHANLAALCARTLAGTSTRIVVTVHASYSRTSWSDHPIKRRLWPLVARFSYSTADAIVSVSYGAADDLARIAGIPRQSITVIANPVVMPGLEKKAGELPDHPWFDTPSSTILLGVGRLCPQKDFPTLIRAFAIVREQYPARLIILGDGPDRAELEALVNSLGLQGAVDLPGFVVNPYAYMANSSLFVLSSAWEALPTVLIEGMAVGTPVVATDCPSGPREILEGGVHGRLVPVGDAAAMAKAILAVLVDDQGQKQKVAIARKRANDFNLERSLNNYLSLIFPSG